MSMQDTIAIIGDGLLAHLILLKLHDECYDRPILWYRGRTAVIPPVSLLHRHVGRSFETDSDRLTAWNYAQKFADRLCDLDPHIAKKITLLRPASLKSRLARSYQTEQPSHVVRHETPSEYYSFLSPSETLFSYPGYAIDTARLLSYIYTHIKRPTSKKLLLVEKPPLTTFFRSEGGWHLVNIHQRKSSCKTLLLTCGHRTSHWFADLPLESYPGEMILMKRPESFPLDVAVSRLGHVVATLDGQYLCAGATFLHPTGDKFPVVDRRCATKAAEECLSGIKKSVPVIRQIKQLKVWYGVRAVLHPDRRPIVGPISDDLIIATALGSKGMLWGPFVAEAAVRFLLGGEDIRTKSISSERLGNLHFSPSLLG